MDASYHVARATAKDADACVTIARCNGELGGRCAKAGIKKITKRSPKGIKPWDFEMKNDCVITAGVIQRLQDRHAIMFVFEHYD